MRRTSTRLLATLAAGTMVIAACGSDSSSSNTTAAPDTTSVETTTQDTTGDTMAPDTTMAESTAWAVNTDDCIDPAAANAPIEGTIKIGSAMPLTGGVAAAAFAPVKGGFEAYINYANEKGLLGDLKAEVTIEDDQYNKDLTPGAISKQIDAGVNIFSGIIGSPNNAAVRDTLNEECIPQLNALTGSPAWGDVANYPWTTGILVPYTVESKVYAKQLAELYPQGATVALFYVNNEFGQVYADAFKELASGLQPHHRRRADHRGHGLRAAHVADHEHRLQEARRDHGGAAGRRLHRVPHRGRRCQGAERRLDAVDVHHQHLRQQPDPRRCRCGR